MNYKFLPSSIKFPNTVNFTLSINCRSRVLYSFRLFRTRNNLCFTSFRPLVRDTLEMHPESHGMDCRNENVCCHAYNRFRQAGNRFRQAGNRFLGLVQIQARLYFNFFLKGILEQTNFIGRRNIFSSLKLNI
jgi:hypothetical protein